MTFITAGYDVLGVVWQIKLVMRCPKGDRINENLLYFVILDQVYILG